MRNTFVRIVKSNDCDQCKLYLPRLDKQGFVYETYDGDAAENQVQLDKWNIEQFPVIQIISRVDGDTGDARVEYQFPPGKTLAPATIESMRSSIQKRLS